MTDTPATAIVISEPSDDFRAPELFRDSLKRAASVWTTWPVESQEDRRILASCRAGSPDRLDLLCPCEIQVANAIVYLCEGEDQATGEIVPFVRTVLITQEGHTFAARSKIIRELVMSLYTDIGPGPWTPPIKLSIRMEPCGGGKSYYKVKMVP